MNRERVIWVTGGSGAIGSAIAQAFARDGSRVFSSSRSIDEAAVASKPQGYGAVIPLRVDIKDSAQVERAAESIIARCGRIDVLVNSTSVSTFGDFLKLTDEDWLSVLDTKLLGYMRTARAVIPQMIKQQSGTIINVSGRGGHQPSSAAHLPGSTANAGVDLLSKGLATYYGPNGVRVVSIAPGPIQSKRYDTIAAANAALDNAGVTKRSKAGEAQGTVDDIAAAALFLASPAARWITGIVLQVDGGGTVGL